MHIDDTEGDLLLHAAAWFAATADCMARLEAGDDPNAINGYGCTPLSSALLQAELMLHGGISFNRKGRSRKRFEEDLRKTVCLLIDHGATLDKATEECMFPLVDDVRAWLFAVLAHRENDQLMANTSPAQGHARGPSRL